MGNLVSGFTVSLSLPVCHAAILSAARGPSAPSVRNPRSVDHRRSDPAYAWDQLGKRDHCPRDRKRKGCEIRIERFKAAPWIAILKNFTYNKYALSFQFLNLRKKLMNVNRNVF